MSIGQKAAKGFVSIFYRNMLEKIVGMAAMLILARKLTPYDFGLVSITDALLYLISTFGTTGLAEYLLAYRKDDSEEVFKSAFWFNIVLSLIVLLVFIASVPLWSNIQGDAKIWKIGLLSSGIFICSQLQVIPKTWLSKHLQFDRQVKIQAPFILLIGFGKVVAAYMGFGVYSLLLPSLIFQPIITILLYRKTGFKPGFQMFTNRWKEIFKFTRYLIGSSVLSRIAEQGDKIILAKLLGLEMLGIYNVALQMADLITSQLVTVSNNILSSVLPNYVNDKEKFYNYYISFLKVFAFIVLPVLGLMILIAKPLIFTIYGPKWIAAALPMQILTVYTAFRALTSSYGCVMNSFHLNKDNFRLNLIYTPVYLAGSFIGASFSVAGLAMSVTIVKLLFINIGIWQTMKAVSLPFTKWYKDLLPYFLVFMLPLAGAIILANRYPVENLQPLLTIGLFTLVFGLGYCLLFRLLLLGELQKISGFLGLTFPRSQKFFNQVFRL
jgi:O-antigen/teichoic acid export membrane protein